MHMLICCLSWVGTSSELGRRQRGGGWRRKMLGYGMAGAFFDCSKFVARRKRGMGKREMKRIEIANMMAYLLMQG